MQRTVFYLSGSTGITAEKLGQSLLAQFSNLELDHITLPFIDTVEKAEDTVSMINIVGQKDTARPIIFDTLIDQEIKDTLKTADAFFIDVFGTYLKPLERELASNSLQQPGMSHKISEEDKYHDRIEAMNFALTNDDGARTQQYDNADIILTGVSRCGKTPICLYLALQFGIRAANYPLTVDDIDTGNLPRILIKHRHKLFGLTTDPERLSKVRNERQPNSRYAALRQCRFEVNEVEQLMDRHRIPYLNTSNHSIEEISSKVVTTSGLKKRC